MIQLKTFQQLRHASPNIGIFSGKNVHGCSSEMFIVSSGNWLEEQEKVVK